MHQAESSSSLLCLWTGRSLPAAPHPVARRRSCLPLRTDQCFCPMGTFTPLLVRTFRRTSQGPSGPNRLQIRQAHSHRSQLISKLHRRPHSQRSPHRRQMAFHLGHPKVMLFSPPDDDTGGQDIDERECSKSRNRGRVNVSVFQGFD
jgi:hypothetical protein